MYQVGFESECDLYRFSARLGLPAFPAGFWSMTRSSKSFKATTSFVTLVGYARPEYLAESLYCLLFFRGHGDARMRRCKGGM
jgi:hypothetical protein